nr:hypothetical protein [Solirubrobacteraceae bacterium]
SQRLEGIEDAVDRLDERLAGQARAGTADDRLAALEERLAAVDATLTAIASSLADLRAPAPARRPAAKKPAAKKPAAES